MSSTLTESSNVHLNSKFKLKKATTSIKEFLENGTDNAVTTLNRYLQTLSYTTDFSIFDPHTPFAVEFFTNLYELMKNVSPRSQFAWCGVDVLSNICHNSSARKALIETYNFLPSLSKMLTDNLTMDKKIKLLRLIQDITCGIKISWQIPHLPHLITTLVSWIECPHESIIALSLGILVNLCYKSLPPIYTLTSIVDIKKLLRNSLSFKGDPVIEVHACRLLIIIERINGNSEIINLQNLVHTTFRSVTYAYKNKDPIILRQMVGFFVDVLQREIIEDQNYKCELPEDKINALMTLLDNSLPDNLGPEENAAQDPECVAAIFEFVHCLLEMNKENFQNFFQKLIHYSLEWLQTEDVSIHALAILRTIALSTPPEKSAILRPLMTAMPVFLLTLETGSNEEVSMNSSHNKKMSTLLQLLTALVKVNHLRPKIIQDLNRELIMKIFYPLHGDEPPGPKAIDIDLSSDEAISFYVYTISLVNELAKHEMSWQEIRDNLFKQKLIHFMLSQAMYKSTKEIKEIIFEMCSLSDFLKCNISSTMSSIQSLVAVHSKSLKNPEPLWELNFPVLSITQNERLDQLISKLKDAFEDRNMLSVSMSDVMELYEYKLASMGHAARVSTASVEAATERCTQLQQQNTHLTTELNRLRQLLVYSQHRYEREAHKRTELEQSEQELKEYIETESERKHAILETKECELMNLKQDLEENVKLLQATNKAKVALEEQIGKLKHLVSKMEDNCSKLEKNLQKKDDSLKKSNLHVEKLKQESAKLGETLKKTEEVLNQRDMELEQAKDDLETKRKFIEQITKMAAEHNKH